MLEPVNTNLTAPAFPQKYKLPTVGALSKARRAQFSYSKSVMSNKQRVAL